MMFFANAFWIRVRKKYHIFANANPKRVRKIRDVGAIFAHIEASWGQDAMQERKYWLKR